jgi:hypothetical protein
MRAADLARRQQQEIPLPDVVMEDDNDLPLTFSSSIGQASQMEIPILPSDPVAPSGELRSTVTIPSGLFSDVVSHPAAPPAPVIQYVAGLIPLNPAQYSVMASQGHTQDAFFECLEPAPFCNCDPVPSRYRVLPGVNICIWCNNHLPLDTLSKRMWCGGVDGVGHDVWRSDMDLENNTFCNACEESITMA